jgi:hypothetical protein
MILFKPTILPKNERPNSTLILCDLFLFIFWKKSKKPKKHFEINWRFFQKTNQQIQLCYFATFFHLFFGRNQRNQKNISKLTDLYQVSYDVVFNHPYSSFEYFNKGSLLSLIKKWNFLWLILGPLPTFISHFKKQLTLGQPYNQIIVLVDSILVGYILVDPLKGQTNSKLFVQADVSSKKRTNNFDLYYLSTCFRSFLEESEDTKKTLRN